MRENAPAEVWTVRQAAEFLNCHPETVKRRVRDGRLTRYSIGRNIRVDAAEVRALLVTGGAR